MIPVFIQRQHLNWDVSGTWILFQMIKNRPAQHVRQEHVQRNGGGMEFSSQAEGYRSLRRIEGLEGLVMREVRKEPSIMHVIFNDQQDSIAWFQNIPIVRKMFFYPVDHRSGGKGDRTGYRGPIVIRSNR